MSRQARIERKTSETAIVVEIDLDGSGSSVDTGIPFMDHMLNLFAKHGFLGLQVKADGDLEIDEHHTMEDLGITLGQAIREALGDRQGITRYGSFYVPMDETLARVVLDISGRPFLSWSAEFPRPYVNGMDVQLFEEFFRGLTVNLGINLHVDVIRGNDVHHIAEAIFKAFARALSAATTLHPRQQGLPTTKGHLD